MTLSDLWTTQTRHVVEERRNRNLEMSVTPGGPTRPHGRVEAESGESNAPDMSHMDQIWWGNDAEPLNAKTRLLEPIEDGPRALGQHDH